MGGHMGYQGHDTIANSGRTCTPVSSSRWSLHGATGVCLAVPSMQTVTIIVARECGQAYQGGRERARKRQRGPIMQRDSELNVSYISRGMIKYQGEEPYIDESTLR